MLYPSSDAAHDLTDTGHPRAEWNNQLLVHSALREKPQEQGAMEDESSISMTW